MTSIQPEAYITSATVLSIQQRILNPKRFVYEIEVEWSNSLTTTCYRGYTDFFKFQCELIDMFPVESGLAKGAKRCLPYLPGRKVFQRSTLSLATQRLPQLDQYVKELIAMPERVSRCNYVLQFFSGDWREDELRREPNPSLSGHAALRYSQEGAVEYCVRTGNEDVLPESPLSPDQ